MSGDERRGISESKLPACSGGLWPRGRSEVSSCFDLPRLGLKDWLQVASTFLPADSTTAGPATMGNSPPRSGLWAYTGHLTCFLVMSSITEPRSSGSSQLQGAWQWLYYPFYASVLWRVSRVFSIPSSPAPLHAQSRNGSAISLLALGKKY